MGHKGNSKLGLSFILKTNIFWRIGFYFEKSIKILKEIPFLIKIQLTE